MKEYNDDSLTSSLIWLGFWLILFLIGYVKHKINKKNID